MEQEILDILNEINPYADIGASTNLLEDVLDSLEILLFVTELEKKYSVEIPFETLQPENFKSLDRVVRLVQKLLGADV